MTEGAEGRNDRMATADSDYFRDLPPLTHEVMVAFKANDELSLVMLENIDIGRAALFSVQYKHRELIYRSPGQKDAVAHGMAKLEGSEEFQEARILFSKPHATATLRGLALEGHVKLGPTSRSTRSRAKTRAPG